MRSAMSITRTALAGLIAAGIVALAGCGGMESRGGQSLTLTGAQEVPPVSTPATGSGTITVHADRAVTGSVTVSGMSAVAAHIHTGAPGQNGPVIIPLAQSGNTWSVPAGARLTDAQYDSYKAGHLYVNVHSANHKGGEVRAQLKP